MDRKFTVEKLDPSDEKISFVELISELKNNMRERDLIDLGDTCDDVDGALIASIRLSEEVYVYRNDEGKALCVVGKSMEDKGSIGRAIWMVGTNLINDGYVRPLLIKEARRLIGEWVKKHGLLYNCVHEDNVKSIRYMTMLGAKWLPEMTERNGKKFYNFYIVGGDA